MPFIAVDSSALISFVHGESFPTMGHLELALSQSRVYLPNMVRFEVLSGPRVAQYADVFLALPVLPQLPDFWLRAAEMRRALLTKKSKCNAGDALIAQSCIDSGIALLTLDKDFKRFTPFGLELYAPIVH